MDWACVPVAASARVPVRSSVHRNLVADMSVLPFLDVAGSRPLTWALMMFLTIRSLLPPGQLFRAAGSTETDVETREELSVEETERADIMP